MKKVTMIFGLLWAYFVFANVVLANTSTTSLSEHGGEKKFTVDFVLASEQTKDSQTYQMNGSYNKLDASALYAVTPDDEMRLFASALYVVQNDPTAEDQLKGDLAEIMYRRKNIMTEFNQGVSLDAEFKYYQLVDDETKKLYGLDGAFIPQLIMKKHWSDSFVTEFKARHHFNTGNNGKASTLKSESRLYLTPTYVLTHTLFFSTTLKYQHKVRNGRYFSYRTFSSTPQTSDHLTVHPGLMYMINRQFLIEGYAETELLTSNDQQTFKKNWQKSYVLGTALYWTAF